MKRNLWKIAVIFLTIIIVARGFGLKWSVLGQSLGVKKEVSVLPGNKKNYGLNEKVKIKLDNQDGRNLKARVIDENRVEISVEIIEKSESGISQFEISPLAQFKPGKYTLEITDEAGNVVEQDFSWGVLAINFNKAIYTPGDMANVALAVLDEKGAMVCGAKLILTITSPSGQKNELSTDNGQIIVNPECQSKEYTLKPDYEAQYEVTESGDYVVELNAQTENGEYSINDAFKAEGEPDFQVERMSATRIFPVHSYEMTIKIVANEDFKGKIYEAVPTSFEISQMSGVVEYKAINKEDKNNKIEWQIDIKKGEEISLGYKYKAPEISPQFYLTGPLTMMTLTDLVYSEGRQWQIAADDISGPVFPTASSNNTSIGTVAWLTPTAAKINNSDGTYVVTNILGKGITSQYLTATGFDFSNITVGSSINGILVEIERHASNVLVLENSVRLLINGTPTGTNMSTSAALPASDQNVYTSYGGSTNNWGISTLSRADVQNTNFGVAFSVRNSSTKNSSYTASVDAIRITVYYTPPPAPNLTQIHYRWRNDNGSESTATWRRAEDVLTAAGIGEHGRLRLEISNEGLATATGTTYRLEYGEKGGGTCEQIATWTPVPTTATTEDFQLYNSTFLDDGTATTNITSGLTDENTTFVAGQLKDTSNQTGGITLTSSEFTEIEYSFGVTSNAVQGELYCFRLTNAGSTTNFTYTKYAEFSVGTPSIRQTHYRWRDDDGHDIGGTRVAGIIKPNADTGTTLWTVTPSGSHYSVLATGITQPGFPPSVDYISTSSYAATDIYEMETVAGSGSYSKIDVWAYAKSTDGSEFLDVNLIVGGTPQSAVRHNVTGTYGWYKATFIGTTLTQTQMDNLQVSLLYTKNGGSTLLYVSSLYAEVTEDLTLATWLKNEDTAYTSLRPENNIRLRLQIGNSGTATAARDFRLEYAAKNGTSCDTDESYNTLPVTATTEPFEMKTTTFYTNGESAVSYLTPYGTYLAGKLIENPSNSSGIFDIEFNDYTEMEYNFWAKTNATGSYCFRATDVGTTLNSYLVYPELQIALGPQMNQVLRHGEWFVDGVRQLFTF